MGLGLSCFGKSSPCFGNQNTKKRKLEMERELRCSTLEEWLAASPGRNKSCPSIGGEFVVFRQSSSSKKIHPSNSVSEIAETYNQNVDGGTSFNGGEAESALCRSLTGKCKKRVSFRLPEESDIFVFYSSPEF